MQDIILLKRNGVRWRHAERKKTKNGVYGGLGDRKKNRIDLRQTQHINLVQANKEWIEKTRKQT